MKKKLIVVPLVAMLFFLSAMNTPAFADGALFIGDMLMWQDLYQSAQKAVILYDSSSGNGTQHLILSVSFEGDAGEFAWVVPVPGKPEIDVSDAKLFEELSDFTTRAIPGSGKPGFGCFLPTSAPPPDGVEVIEEKVVGPYATAILAATDPTALVDWLNENGYLFPEEGEEIIAEYIEKEWFFVATRINAVDAGTGRALAEGAIEPIVLSFASDEIVYPLRITSLSATSPEILLYVFADRVVVPGQYPFRATYGIWRENAFSLEFGDKVSVEDLSEYEVLPEVISTYLTGDEFYLTKLRGEVRADRMVDMEFIEYETGGQAYTLGYSWSGVGTIPGTSLTYGDLLLLMIITVPVVGLLLWRRRRNRAPDAGPRGNVWAQSR